VAGVKQAKQYGRWGFAAFTDIYLIDADFKAKVEGEFNKLLSIAM
jgi:type III restriction enzyme